MEDHAKDVVMLHVNQVYAAMTKTNTLLNDAFYFIKQ